MLLKKTDKKTKKCWRKNAKFSWLACKYKALIANVLDEVAKELETTLKGKLYLAPFNLINYVSVVS